VTDHNRVNMEPIRVTAATASCHPVLGTSWHPCQEVTPLPGWRCRSRASLMQQGVVRRPSARKVWTSTPTATPSSTGTSPATRYTSSSTRIVCTATKGMQSGRTLRRCTACCPGHRPRRSLDRLVRRSTCSTSRRRLRHQAVLDLHPPRRSSHRALCTRPSAEPRSTAVPPAPARLAPTAW